VVPKGGAEERAIVVVGAGSGGVPEMVEYMSNDEVMWALLRFEFGSGAFTRTKYIFMHFNADNIPVMKRCQAASLTKTAKHYLSSEGKDHFHGACELRDLADVTAEFIMTEVSEHFVVDSIAGASTTAMIKQYQEQLEKERWAAEEREKEAAKRRAEKQARRRSAMLEMTQELIEEFQVAHRDSPKSTKSPKSGGTLGHTFVSNATRLSKASRVTVMKIIRQNSVILTQLSLEGIEQVAKGGLWNWVLFGPDADKLPLLGGGSGGVAELKGVAEENEDLVMFGLLRAQLILPGLSETRFAMVHIVGSELKAVRRAKLNALRPKFEAKFREYCHLQVIVADLASSSLEADFIIEKMGWNEAAIQEKSGLAGAATASSVVQAYKKALEEEQHNAYAESKPDPRRTLALKMQEADNSSEDGMDARMSEAMHAIASLAQEIELEAIPECEDEDEQDSMVDEEPIFDFEKEDEAEEEVKLAPNALETLETVNNVVRTDRECNWALVRPRPKPAAK